MAETAIDTSEAIKIVRNYTLASVMVSTIPVPIVDLVALSSLQLKMLHRLATLYQIPFSEQLGKSLIASLVGGGVPLSLSSNLSKWAASLAKSMPGVGTAAGMVGVAAFGGASTYAIGKVFTRHFESGGTLLDFDPQHAKDDYAKQLKEGSAEVTTVVEFKP
jgi:uncharacterized protein (DUF697 family)